MNFGTLVDDLGCFPFDYEAYPPQSDSRIKIMAFLVCEGSVIC